MSAPEIFSAWACLRTHLKIAQSDFLRNPTGGNLRCLLATLFFSVACFSTCACSSPFYDYYLKFSPELRRAQKPHLFWRKRMLKNRLRQFTIFCKSDISTFHRFLSWSLLQTFFALLLSVNLLHETRNIWFSLTLWSYLELCMTQTSTWVIVISPKLMSYLIFARVTFRLLIDSYLDRFKNFFASLLSVLQQTFFTNPEMSSFLFLLVVLWESLKFSFTQIST